MRAGHAHLAPVAQLPKRLLRAQASLQVHQLALRRAQLAALVQAAVAAPVQHLPQRAHRGLPGQRVSGGSWMKEPYMRMTRWTGLPTVKCLDDALLGSSSAEHTRIA